MNLNDRIHQLFSLYPRQFWLVFFGNLLSTVGTSMIWPFMMVYASQKLDLPLTAVAGLLTINSVMSLLSSFVAGSLADRTGRRKVMIIGLLLHGIVYLFFNLASTFWAFAFLMAVSGFVNPIYRVGVDAMVADLIPQHNRPDAYALLRMGNNIGIALGPTIGGFLATQSYTIVFFCAAAGLIFYGLLTLFFSKETLVKSVENTSTNAEKLGGYDRVLRDSQFLTICIAFTVISIASSLVFVLLSVYTKTQFAIPENEFGFIMATNAAMVILFQVIVTRIAKRFSPYPVMVLGAFLYSLGVGSMALWSSTPAFIVGIIIMTSGELLLVPTTTTLIANLAPQDMRGRYMSVYGLTWGIASGIGPVMGGFLNDQIAPVSIWYGGFIIGMSGMLLFAILAVRQKKTVQSV